VRGAVLVILPCAAWLAFHVPLASQARPLPAPEPFYAQIKENLARADREQHRYAYRERRSEVHSNPFGKIGTDGTLLYDVRPGAELGLYHRRLIERDGKALTNEKSELLDRRNRGKANPSIEDVVATLEFHLKGRESVGGRDHIIIEFRPKQDADPRTRQGKIAQAFKGTVWVDEASREVARVEATSIDSLSYGFGLVARLGEGTRATLIRERIDSSVWLPTSIRLVGEGRALLLRKLRVDFVVEWFDYKRTLD